MSGASSGRAIALAAALIALGNIVSRVVGLLREASIAYFFERSSAIDAFTLAWTVPNIIYDLLISGAVSAALVPVLSEYAEGDEAEFGSVVSAVFGVTLGAMVVLLGLAAWQAPLLSGLLVQPEQAALRAETALLIQQLMPAVLLMGISGLATAVLHAQRRFLGPAFVGAIFNGGLILGMALFHRQLGASSLALGAVIGGLGQVALQLPGLLRVRWRRGGLGHPALARIARLYAPVMLGIGFSVVGGVIDRYLASGFAGAPSTMRYATTLVQFPLGLVAAAVSLAVLPTLARHNANGDESAFQITLAMGLKVVLVLIIPATVGLAVLATPITALLLQRGAFGSDDSAVVALALIYYLPGMPAAALDQVLLFAFYARKNTLVPNLIQGAAILCYLAVSLPLLALSQLGFLALVIGNSAQWIGHAVLIWLLMRRSVPLGGQRLGETALKTLGAAAAMGGLLWAAGPWLSQLPLLLHVAVAALLGGGAYLALCALLRVEALSYLIAAVRQRIGR